MNVCENCGSSLALGWWCTTCRASPNETRHLAFNKRWEAQRKAEAKFTRWVLGLAFVVALVVGLIHYQYDSKPRPQAPPGSVK